MNFRKTLIFLSLVAIVIVSCKKNNPGTIDNGGTTPPIVTPPVTPKSYAITEDLKRAQKQHMLPQMLP